MVSAANQSTEPKLQVLVVEDDLLVGTCIGQMLEGSGFHVTGIVTSAWEAILVTLEQLPGLALVDIRLAGPTDGIELACLLRRQFSVPSIFLSAFFDEDTRRRALVAEPLGFLAKPFRPSQLYNAIEHLSESSGVFDGPQRRRSRRSRSSA
jgi:DNA-binding response OmpR family regulator